MILALSLILFAAAVAPSQAQEQPQNQAGVVIRFGDGQVVTSCVRFSEPSLTGLELLQRSGAAVIAQQGGVGAAVCKIGSEGCDYPGEDCFCKCKGADCNYWAYQRLRGDTWAYSPLGAAAAKVLPGDVDGWAWGAGSVQQGAAPPVVPIEAICAVPNAAPTATLGSTVQATATSTQVPPTAMPQPTLTIQPVTATPQATRATAIREMPTAIQRSPTSLPATATREMPSATILQATNTPNRPDSTQAAVVASAPTSTIARNTEPPATSPQPPAPSNPTNYVFFGVIVLILIAGIILATRRRQ